MQLSIAKDIFGSPWHMSAIGLQQYLPIVSGMINGAVIVQEQEPAENIPYACSAESAQPVNWSTEEEDIPEEEPRKEKVVHVLPVRGVIMKHDMMCGPRGTRTLANRLREADSDESVIGHVLIFEGPGGAANAVPELADVMKECKKPILGWVDGIAASAHQYVLSYCTEKWASRDTDIVGSIGTMLQFRGRIAKSEEDLFKEREVTIYADDAFEKNEEYEKAINDFDFKLAKQRVLNPHNEKFQNDIKANCPGVEDKHLHGRTFSAIEVLGSLIDKIGSLSDAIKRVVEMSGYTSKSNSNSNQSIKNMKQFTALNGVLGVDSLESQDDQVSLNEEQLELVDTALSGNEQAVAAARTAAEGERDSAVAERDTAVQERDTAQNELSTAQTDLTNAIAAFDALDETVAAAEGYEAKAEAVRTLLASKPGAAPSGIKEGGDPAGSLENEDWETIDALDHNKEVDKNS